MALLLACARAAGEEEGKAMSPEQSAGEEEGKAMRPQSAPHTGIWDSYVKVRATISETYRTSRLL
jgi:hypothetical protein